MPSLALAALLLARVPVQAASDVEPPAFVFENGAASQMAFKDDVLHLRQGRGWVRTRHIFNDFVLTLEFRLADAKTEAGVGIRTLSVPGLWPDHGYHLALSGALAGTITPRRDSIDVIAKPAIPAPAAGEWHSLVVSAEGPRVTVTIDGGPANVARIEARTGSIRMDVNRGRAEFRHIRIRMLPLSIPVLPFKELERATNEITGLVPPKPVYSPRPNYTRRAMERKVEGEVALQAVVLEDGTVGAVAVTKLPDPDLEQAAVAAVLKWRFTPATRDGHPVAIWVVIELTFTLR